MRLLEKYLLTSIPREGEGAGGGGAGAGGAGAGGAGAGGGGAGGGGAGAGGAGAGAGAGGAGAGAGAGGAGASAGGGGSDPWYKPHNFDAETVAWIEERKFADLPSTVKAGREGSAMARNRNVIDKPDPKKPGEWKGYSELGWVEDASKYSLKKPELKNGEVLHEGMFNAFSKAAHANKVAPWQAEAIYSDVFRAMNDELGAEDARAAKALTDAENALRTEWGGDYPRNKEIASRAMKFFGIGAQDAKHLDAVLGAPGLVKLFHQLGTKALTEDELKLGGGGGPVPKSLEALRAELNALHADENFKKAFHEVRHPQHKDFSAKRQRLIDQIAALETSGKTA